MTGVLGLLGLICLNIFSEFVFRPTADLIRQRCPNPAAKRYFESKAVFKYPSTNRAAAGPIVVGPDKSHKC